jgi:hypothetical protein
VALLGVHDVLSLITYLIDLVKSEGGLKERYCQKIALIMVVEWNGGAGRLSDSEFRDMLLHGGEVFRQHVLWFIERQYDQAKGAKDKLAEEFILLLDRVWPRQRVVRTPKISSQLCEIAFAMMEQFPQVVRSVLPLLAPADPAHIQIPKLRKNGQKLSESYPEEMLALLDAVLSDNPQMWPHRIEEVFDEISTAQEGRFANNPRLLRLKRIFHNR